MVPACCGGQGAQGGHSAFLYMCAWEAQHGNKCVVQCKAKSGCLIEKRVRGAVREVGRALGLFWAAALLCSWVATNCGPTASDSAVRASHAGPFSLVSAMRSVKPPIATIASRLPTAGEFCAIAVMSCSILANTCMDITASSWRQSAEVKMLYQHQNKIKLQASQLIV